MAASPPPHHPRSPSLHPTNPYTASVPLSHRGLHAVCPRPSALPQIFGAALGAQTAAVAATYPSLVASANMGGRFAWGPISDGISCMRTTVLFGLSVPAILLGPYATGIVATDPEMALNLFK